MVAKGEGDGRAMGWNLGEADANSDIDGYRWINHRVLPYSTGNCIQYPVINHHGKNMKKNI